MNTETYHDTSCAWPDPSFKRWMDFAISNTARVVFYYNGSKLIHNIEDFSKGYGWHCRLASLFGDVSLSYDEYVALKIAIQRAEKLLLLK